MIVLGIVDDIWGFEYFVKFIEMFLFFFNMFD